jgi:hypothetical protein
MRIKNSAMRIKDSWVRESSSSMLSGGRSMRTEDDQEIAVEAGSALARVALKRSPNNWAIAFNPGVFLAAVLMWEAGF